MISFVRSARCYSTGAGRIWFDSHVIVVSERLVVEYVVTCIEREISTIPACAKFKDHAPRYKLISKC
jgi:hypothetical protein